jgi:hypothetical protein
MRLGYGWPEDEILEEGLRNLTLAAEESLR